MTPQEIKDRLEARGIRSQAHLARRLRTSKTSAHFLVHKKLSSKRLVERFARLIQAEVSELRGA